MTIPAPPLTDRVLALTTADVTDITEDHMATSAAAAGADAVVVAGLDAADDGVANVAPLPGPPEATST